ncbi:hypothetical protein ACHAWT_004663 [Skeletonema menzelii]
MRHIVREPLDSTIIDEDLTRLQPAPSNFLPTKPPSLSSHKHYRTTQMKRHTELLLLAWAAASSSQCPTVAAYVAPFTSRRRLCTSFQNSANENENVDATIFDSNDSSNQSKDLYEYDSAGSSSSRRGFFQRSSANAFAVASTACAFLTTGSSSSSHTIANAALLSSSSSSVPPLNTPAPDFELPNSRNINNNNDDEMASTTTSLTSLLNTKKWTVLYFYPGAFTSGCTLEAHEGGQVSKLYGTSLSLPGFGTFSNRQTYVIDPRGDVRWVFLDVDSKIPRHSGDVLEKLRELQQQE